MELEEQEGGADAAAVLLRRYSPASGTWDLVREGNFWDAVASAHGLGRLGEGRTIVIVDTGFDLTIPALAAHATSDAVAPDAPTAHGTVAALLALEVAPNARLSLQAASVGGKLRPERVIAAIERAVREGADIINLSMGAGLAGEAVRAGDGPPTNPAYGTDALEVDDWRSLYDIPVTPLWSAARAAAHAGVTVVASAGNSAGYVFVPAAVPGVVSVGFQTVARLVDEGLGMEEATSAPPSYSQALGADVMLVQPAHVLGSSFACPLISGFAAVMGDRAELPRYLDCLRRAANASDLLKLLDPGMEATDRAVLATDSLFKGAFATAPHPHWDRPEDGPCPECALFALPMLIDFGLFTLITHNPHIACMLLETARRVAPRDPYAAASFGVALDALAGQAAAAGDVAAADGLRARAVDSMADAVRLRPGHLRYQQRLDEFRAARRTTPPTHPEEHAHG